MPYMMTATRLKKLFGRSAVINNQDGTWATVTVPQQPEGWPRKGAEAYGLMSELTIRRPSGAETIPAFLKVFFTEVSVRHDRSAFLIGCSLADKSHLYKGVPILWLGREQIGEVEVIAHATRMIASPFGGSAENFKNLRRGTGWQQYNMRQRAYIGRELASAVAGLERAGLVHGDISPANLLIGHNSLAEPHCILCDYDGFFHPSVPRLPRKVGAVRCRPIGVRGYQYPELLTAYQSDPDGDTDIWVESDRFALAVAICEMAVWSPDVEEYLSQSGRRFLLSDEIIMNRDITRLPKEIVEQFPDGFALLDRALGATGFSEMPSPGDWLRTLSACSDAAR